MVHSASLIVLFCFTLAAVHGKVTLLFTETSPGTYFKSLEDSHGRLNANDLTATAASLLSIGALSAVDADVSSKVRLVKMNAYVFWLMPLP